MAVHSMLLGDWVHSFSESVPAVLAANVRVVVYSGDKDFICNWRGGEKWTHDMAWPGQSKFVAAPYQSWNVDGKPAGQVKSADGFTFLRVFHAGHMVPKDQPAVAQAMIDEVLRGAF